MAKKGYFEDECPNEVVTPGKNVISERIKDPIIYKKTDSSYNHPSVC